MRRRSLLKGLSVVAAVGVVPGVSRLALGEGGEPGTPLAMPIRGLIKSDGRLVQPIDMAIPHAGGNAEVVVRLDGVEAARRKLAAGMNRFSVMHEAVDAPKQVKVEVGIGEDVTERLVELQPVRKMVVYLLNHSHHDLGYTDQQAEVEVKQMNNISQGIELARKTAGYPAGSRFVWNLEVLWGADLYLKRKPEAGKAAFIEAVKKGWVSINGMYANELTGLCRPEELLQLFRFGTELGARCGVKVDAAMASDVPGFTWGTVTAMAQAGIRYFSTAPNYFDRIGRLMVEYQDKPFWWVSRSGNEKVLVWIPWTGYALSAVINKMDRQFVGKYQDRLDLVEYGYEISHMRWSGHGDNAEPDPELPEFVKTWNAEFEWPKFQISSTSEAFAAFEKRYGEQIPKRKGDLTPFWEDGAGSSAVETRMSRNAAERITQAETLSALLAPMTYKPEVFTEAWRNVLLYSEHTWGAWSSVSDSENPFTTKQWEFKRKFAVDAEKQSVSLLEGVMTAYGSGAAAGLIDVHNSCSWVRSEVVLLSKEMSAAGDHVRDAHGKVVASQRLASGELAVMVEALPAFGTARLKISSGKAQAPAKAVSVKDGVLENGLVRVKVDAATGNVAELMLVGKTENLIDAAGGEQANEWLFLEGSDVAKIQKAGAVTITVEESGPLVATVKIEGSAPGCKSMTRRVTLTAGTDWVELSNTLDKKRAGMNPAPGKEGPGGQFAQRGSKESGQFAFPFKVSGGEMRMDIPLAEMRPEMDQLEGTCKNWLPVGRWVDVANAKEGVTWVTLDAPLIEAGEVSANMLGSQRDPYVWREYIEPSQKFYSWAINNHWGTNYRAYQEGMIEFRYALRPHSGYSAAAATRLATGMTQPLVASKAGGKAIEKPLLKLDSEEVVVMSLKPSADGKAWMVRLFGASGESRKVKLEWAGKMAAKTSISNTAEVALTAVDGDAIEVGGWDVVTLRVERAG